MKKLTPKGAAVRFLNGAGYLHHVSYRRAVKMLDGSLPLDIMAVATMADRVGVAYIEYRDLLEKFVHEGGQL